MQRCGQYNCLISSDYKSKQNYSTTSNRAASILLARFGVKEVLNDDFKPDSLLARAYTPVLDRAEIL